MIIKKFINGKVVVETNENEINYNKFIKKNEEQKNNQNQQELQQINPNNSLNQAKKNITYHHRSVSSPQRGGCGCGGR